VIYQVLWSVPALDRAAGYLREDADGLAAVLDATDDLTRDRHPETSIPLGSEDLRRIHVGRYRVMYEIDHDTATITVIHLGRVG
jgi:mRNA interferase RelE/StbE